MESLNILRIPSEEGNGGFVLVQVTSSGSKTLDVKLVATEGQAPYAAKCKTISPNPPSPFPRRFAGLGAPLLLEPLIQPSLGQFIDPSSLLPAESGC